jgi:hypothetical protein
MTKLPPNHALQRTRPSRRGCKRTPSCAGSLSLGRSGVTDMSLLSQSEGPAAGCSFVSARLPLPHVSRLVMIQREADAGSRGVQRIHDSPGADATGDSGSPCRSNRCFPNHWLQPTAVCASVPILASRPAAAEPCRSASGPSDVSGPFGRWFGLTAFASMRRVTSRHRSVVEAYTEPRRRLPDRRGGHRFPDVGHQADCQRRSARVVSLPNHRLHPTAGSAPVSGWQPRPAVDEPGR